ncbi:RNA polymerase sigma factor [Demequina maris]|uniref:RNA polymerase sigma factor n=1 Tax=Demequina maris TaxID=1638982 RepID=UPI000784FE57|nr:sigma-70 family RNA polymerase sigma factor [Demequina maris]
MNAWEGVLERLVVERRSTLVGYAFVLCADRAAAEDLVHDAIIRTFSRAIGLKDVEHAENYVKRTIRTQYLNGRRHDAVLRRKRHLLVAAPAAAADVGVAEQADLRAALAELRPQERACVLLRFYDGLALAEIAAELQVGVGTVKRYLFNATRRLRGILEVDDADLEVETMSARVTSSEGRTR